VSARVYWRRRILLLLVLVVIVWGAVKLIGTVRGDGKPDPAPTTKASASASPSASQATEQPDPGLLPVKLTSDAAACDAETVRITPTVPPKQQVGGDVAVDLLISSTSPTSCTLTPADAGLIAVIGSGSSTVWDSTRCSTSLLTDPVEISARWATMVRVEWSGRASGSKCSDDEAYAAVGDYTLKLGTLGGEPGKASFSLVEKKAEEPDTEEKPTDGETPDEG